MTLEERIKELEAERDRAEKIVRDLCETFGVHHPDVIAVKYNQLKKDSDELNKLKAQVMNLFTGGKLFPDREN